MSTGLPSVSRAPQAADFSNLIINSAFDVAQRGTSFTSATTYPNNDDAFTFDRWLLLSDGNDILDVTQETGFPPDGAAAACKLDVETANKRAGIAQILEYRDCLSAIANGKVSLSFVANRGGSNTTVDTLRVIVASWTSSIDTVTSDLVSAWSTEGNNPTLATNWTIEASDTFALATTFQTFKLENIAIDTASVKQFAVFIMIENDDGTVGDTVLIGNVQLNVGRKANTFRRRPLSIEQRLCYRYFWKIESADEANMLFAIGQAHATTLASCALRFPVEMRRIPTASVSSVSHWAFVDAGFATFIPWTTFGTNYLGATGGRISATASGGGLVAGNATMILSNGGIATAKMFFDAEL
jgi:hypothetical protein